MNNKGQLSIIAALLVATVLVGTILVTFSKIRDSSIQESPQILSAIDEIDLAIDQILSSTIRYYGSILKVTGNSSYARSSAQSFLYNETKNIPSMYPGWGISLSVRDVKLRVNWFSNYSYSSGTLSINYDLKGLGLSNINYNSSSSLMVQTNNETTASRARLTVTRDLGSPVANLGRQNFGFYSYNYTDSTWNVVSPNTLSTTFTNGTYVVDLPQGVDSDFYVIQVEDQRGLMVLSSSSSFLASGLNWNASQNPSAHYVDNNVSNVDSIGGIGSHSNFTAQQIGPDSICDTLTEGLASETPSPTYYPSSYNLLGSTQLVSGTLPNLQADDGVCMTFRSYQTASSNQTLYAHAETTNIGGTTYYLQKLVSADGTATDLSASMSTTGRKAMGKFVYPLTGVSSIPASTWTVYYRAYGTASNTHSLRASGGYMRVGDGTPNWGSATGTISFWVKWSTVSGRPWGQHENMETRMSASRLVLDWGGSTSLTSTRSFVAGTWYFIAIVWNQNADRLYLYVGDQSNSPALDAQATWTGSVSSVGVPQNNFMASKGGVEPLNGYGDELRYWNTDRSLASIQSDYKTELSGSESNLRSYFKLNNNFNDTGPNQSNGSGLESYSFSSDVPFATSSTAHGDVDILIRASDGTIRQTVATDVANSNNVGGSWSTLSGTYSWVNYTIVDQTDYLEIDYYMHVTSAGGKTVYLKVDDPALNIIDQTRVSGVMLPSEYTVEAEFTGISDTQSWNQLVWTIDSGFTTTDVTARFQLYNYTAGAYSTSGDGYITDTIGTANVTKTQIITINPTGFRDASGNWRLKVKGVKTTTAQFDWRGDLVQYRVNYTTSSDYRLDLEEQWTNVDYSQTDQLAIYVGGSNSTENMKVDFWNGATWNSLFTDLMYGWNNISISSYLTSSTFTIRFADDDQTGDTVQDTWQIDASLLLTNANTGLYGQLQNTTIPIELLQNGTMLWLGQELATAKARPIPPIPVKSFHVNQTINGIDREVPFQVEDWASDYRIPLGLSSNSSVFSSRSMLVYLVTPRVSRLTVWWNGSDETIQTPYAYINQYFTVNTTQRTVTNGILNLTIDSSSGTFRVNSTMIAGNSSCTSELFRTNYVVARNGSAEPNYAITNGPVRAVIHHEVEWPNNGTPNCPDYLAHLVLTLPANVTYYTYALRLMFLSTQHTRTITDLCPISLNAPISLIQTENGTASGYPIVTNTTTTGLFYNLSQAVWAHHWSQFISGTKGAGIMFTDVENQKLYVFDGIAGAKTGALRTNSTAKKIELLPVTISQFSLPGAFDITWHGAIVTFDGTTPIYKEDQGTKTGLWIIVEYPPSLS